MNNEQAPQRKVLKEFAVETITVQQRRLKAIFADGPAICRTMDIPERIQVLKVPAERILRSEVNDADSIRVAVYELRGVDLGLEEATYAFMRMES